MKFLLAVLPTLLATAIAAPSPKLNAKARLARSASRHQSSKSAAAANDEYNGSWGGAAVADLNSGEVVTGVSATFTVATPAIPSDVSSSDSYTESTWIGIDGDGCNNLWQSGIDGTIDSNGEISYYAWYEWYPAGTEVFDLGTISAGDVVNVNVTTDGLSKGTATIENVTTGKTATKTMTSTNTLCGLTAEWIMEDLGALASFGTVTFDNAVATTNQRTLSPATAQLMDIENDSNVILTSTTVDSTSVAITYK
ncbi:hypothetical protein BP6252_10307 [Coleophoma cylindrospora]|uniref:Aspergillopepsin-2 n=1 Tax=Coleophoma cylindrospora TaxID=1849047 RepID=A0A3D8QS55_9HELO|nr:hypothetical protein BP6252_10307 [Coleophoma cylindrospora]